MKIFMAGIEGEIEKNFILIRLLHLKIPSVIILKTEVFMKESILDRVGREMAEFLQGMRDQINAKCKMQSAKCVRF